ncbi:hypothetical protein Cal7507_3709 [Calothrix sp. PCC 7507]|nr:hypothetical protein Cal7507_3709 [Calothrix sp. PCC 7507]
MFHLSIVMPSVSFTKTTESNLHLISHLANKEVKASGHINTEIRPSIKF